jgi:hypothetical protein
MRALNHVTVTSFWHNYLVYTVMKVQEMRPVLELTQPRILWVPGTVSWGIKWPGREADHLHLMPRTHATIHAVSHTYSWFRS